MILFFKSILCYYFIIGGSVKKSKSKSNIIYFIFFTIILVSIIVVAFLILFNRGNNTINSRMVYAYFVVQDNNAIKESNIKVNCEVIDEKSCIIKVPAFNAREGYTLLGWNTSKDEVSANIFSGNEIEINKSMTYYSITKKIEPLKGNFIIQNNTASKSDSKTSCELYNGKTSCNIIVPTLIENTDNTIIGWNMDKDATVKTLDGGEELTINSDVTYYSITKSNKQLTATFKVLTPSLLSTEVNKVSCELYNGNQTCNIKSPRLTKLIDNVNMMGWSPNEDATSLSIQNEEDITLNNDMTFYSVVSQLITITFDVGEDVPEKNIKPEKLSFNYIDKNGNTIIKEEGQKLTTTCVSYNGKGCKISNLPTIHSKGNYVHGYSKTIGGKNIAALNTTYKEDTTLYTRVGYYNAIAMKTINIGYQKIYGNVIFEIETGVPESYMNKVNELLEKIYHYYPELFFFNGKIFLLSRNTYNTVLKQTNANINSTVGNTIIATNYNNVYVYYSSSNDYLFSLVHEIGHAFDKSYGYHFEKIVSETDVIKSLYNKYKNISGRPLRNYSYTNLYEFVADSFSNTMRELLYQKENKYPYTNQGKLPDDIRNTIIGYINQKRDYLIKNNYIM